MACTDVVCGTGGWSGPKPGDPDNTSILLVTPAFGGNDVTWTLPLTNSHAVSHVNIFRANSNNPNLAIRRAAATGDFYFDKIPSDELWEYFYWIQIVSINGTYGEMIGPVSAIPKPAISEVIAQLAGKINESVLSDTLRTKLGEISLLQTGLNDEINARLTGNTALAEALSAVQSETAQALTYLSEEVTQRTTANEALLNSVNVLAVGLGENTAAIANEALVRATDISAFAGQISTVQSTLDNKIVGVETTMGAAIQDLEQTADALGALYTVKLTADGHVGGFGVYNDGTEVQAVFDVDSFSVGRSSGGSLKPFVVEGNQVFLSNTVVPTIESDNYEAGVSGWKIRKDGIAEFQEIIIGTGGTFGGTLQAATGTFSGALQAATGTFSGTLSAGVFDSSAFNAISTIYANPGIYTITVPDRPSAWGTMTMRVSLFGAGAGGGGGGPYGSSGNFGYSGGGGGGGGAGQVVTFTLVDVVPGTTYTITVGAAGNSGNYPGGSGTAGGASILQGYATASGGSPGTGGKFPTPGVGGSIGGSNGQTGGDLGVSPFYANAAGGEGGVSTYGFGGKGGAGANMAGAGGTSGFPGGNGCVVVDFYDKNFIVTNVRYSNLINWLDGIGNGAVPANAR